MTQAFTPWSALRQRWQLVQQTPADQACASPCMSICVMQDNADECWGCLRSLHEIAQWAASSPQQQRQVWTRVGQRIDQHFESGT
ncbi:MAG: DUF1289 domain-containing protein [Betaproteobacteria bacterium]|nr:DUF1289 domain-containing protein [Betaproteobacteria bacterium]